MRTLALLVALALPAGAHASDCVPDAEFEAALRKVDAANARRRARALRAAKLEALERTPIRIDLRNGAPRVGTILERGGRRLVVVQAFAARGRPSKLLPVQLAKKRDGTLSPLRVQTSSGTHRRLARCGKATCRPGKGTREDPKPTVAGIVLEEGERWSGQPRAVRYRHDTLVGTYSRAANCPPVP